MGNFFDLHRHDQFSFFDGFGKPLEIAKRAKELGYRALGTSNHGNITGLVQHWLACKQAGIKPILGCEIYFQPVFKQNAPERKTYHLCLFVKSIEGYKNICHMLSEAAVSQFYYKPIVDFKLLKKYSNGLICTTACIQSATSQAVAHGNIEMAEKLLNKLKSMFCDDLYIELQPYKVDDKRTQETVDIAMYKLGKKLKIKCIMTSDSHYVRKEDFDTYLKMHEIGKTTLDVKRTYGERWMPSEYEIEERFAKLYKHDFKNPMAIAERLVDNMNYIYDSVDEEILEKLELHLPKIETVNDTSEKELRALVKRGLQNQNKWNKTYKKRCKEELETIHYHGFDDYFLMVQEYVNYARENGIAVGPGRGSACNSMVACAIGITEVDSIQYNLDFSRFMRKDKKKLPDIDVDFETSRRQEVIDHVIEKHKGRAVQICSYGEYTIDNLINDLSGVCGLETSGKDLDEYDKEHNKKIVAEIKKFIHSYEIDGDLNMSKLLEAPQSLEYDDLYDGIIKHFSKMHGKVRHLGKHAAGVAVVGTDILDYTCLVRRGDSFSSCYDLNDLEHINCIKFDMLGLKTMSELLELEEYTGYSVTDEDIRSEKVLDNFREGNTDGIFQMEKKAPKKILKMIRCDCVEDVIAVNALNRPAPLQLKMHETYAYNKLSEEADRTSPLYKYTKETYGTMLYQEQTVYVAQKLGHLTPEQSFDMLKIMKKPDNLNKPEYIPIIDKMRKDFFEGCRTEGLTKSQAQDIWGSMLIYGFNKGHSVGYALISLRQMVYKIKFPAEFWYVKMKYAGNEADLRKYSEFAVKDGATVLLPHVNGSAVTSLVNIDGERVIQQGLSIIKGVGEAAAEQIQEEHNKNGDFIDYDDFYDRCKSRAVTSRVLTILENEGALEFNQKKYERRVIKYNSSLLVKG